jgi:hypothetical protein
MTTTRRAAFAHAPQAFLTGCGSSPGTTDSELTGQASLSITTVPASVRCIEVTVAGSSTVTQQFGVTPGASSVNLAFQRLPLGSATVTGNAYGKACTNLAGQQATWVADSQKVSLKAGEVTTLTLDFREVLPTSGNANFIGTAKQLAVTTYSTVALLADGSTVLTDNLSGGALQSPGYPAATLMAAGGEASGTYGWHVCEVGSDGTTRCFQTRQPSFGGTGTIRLSGTPTELTTGRRHACATVGSGQSAFVQCWGSNSAGQLGDGTHTDANENPSTMSTTAVDVVISQVHEMANISAGGDTTCAVTSFGQVDCWGNNSDGEFGDGTTASSPFVATAMGLTAITQVSVGVMHTCALRADGAVFCWGYNNSGQLGNGTTAQSLVPVQVSGITNATQVVALSTSTCALLSNGTVMCWGDNMDGSLGDGTGQSSTTPVAVKGLHGIAWLAPGPGALHVCASNKQDVWCWGYNIAGQLADGTFDDAFVPVAMSGL